MAFDGIFLHRVVDSLQCIVTGRIVRIYQISDTEILFIVKGHHNAQLMISAHSSYNRIHLSDRQYPTRSFPSNFIMVLRKYLEGGFITSIKQVGLDRYLLISIASRNDIGDRINVQLYVELMGKYANIILVHNNRIIDALKHIPPFENTIRTIQPGAEFKPTAPQKNKIDPFSIDRVDNDENLFEKLTGFSPLLAEEVRYRLAKQSYTQIMEDISHSTHMYISTVNGEDFFHVIPLTHLKADVETHDICEGLDHLYFNKEEKERIRQISGDLFKFIRREINKCNSKIDRLNAQKEEALECDRYRYYGEIIFANLDKITKGDKVAVVEDFEGNTVSVPLDIRLDGKGNGKRMFTRYRKLSTGIHYIDEQLKIAKENLEYFTLIQQQLQMADFKSATEIKNELQANGYMKGKTGKYKSKKTPEPNFASIAFKGQTILVGRNNIQNDYITFKKAGRFDMWFHVKDMSGAHVVVNSEKPDEETIRLCAMLAAYYSKARNSSSIAVNYTLIRNLKKIPASRLGKVIMKEYKTIYIDVDEKRIESLIEGK